MFAELSLEASALAAEIATIEAAPRARQTTAQSSATFLFLLHHSSRRFLPALHCFQAQPRSLRAPSFDQAATMRLAACIL